MEPRLFLGRSVTDDSDFRLKASRLRTHGVVVGMTGSGKTGLSLVALEEAVRAGIPVIAIDPKGDLSNLGLLFSELDPAQAAPWAGRQDPAEICDRWRDGLGRWGMGPAEIADLADRLELKVWTPGSEAGLPVDVVGCFGRPPAEVLEHDESRHTLVSDLVGGLLGLVGRKTDPLRDPAHVVLSHVMEQAWLAGEDLTLEGLILKLVDPPFDKVGVFPLDTFFPPDDRMELAVLLNAVVAAPSFGVWSRGAALDIDALLQPARRTPVHVFHLAHLDESQRQFFVSLLLGRVQAWSRSQPGTEDLRALVFFDEVSGYLPPHPKNPPAKGSLLGLMKQARAVGLGVLLATQNPVDLDYKAISNAGLWCIGRLSTKQDRDRLLKGLGSTGLDSTVAELAKRSFLIVQPGKDEPVVIKSRHALCWLRGPFTRVEIERLVDGLGRPAPGPAAPAVPPAVAAAPAAAPAAPVTEPVAPELEDGLSEQPPASPGPVAYLDPRVAHSARLAASLELAALPPREDGRLVHRAALVAEVGVTFDEAKAGFIQDETLVRCLFPLDPSGPGELTAIPFAEGDLCAAPPSGSLFEALPPWVDEERELKTVGKTVVERIYRSETRGLFRNPKLKLWSAAAEDRAGFEQRCRAAVEDRIDVDATKLRDRYAAKADKLQDRIEARQAKRAEQEGVLRARKMEEAVNVGETLLSFFGGRRRSLSSAMSKRRQTTTTRDRMDRIEQEIVDLREDLVQLEAELAVKLTQARAKHEALLAATAEVPIRLERADVRLQSLGIVWIPVNRRL